MYHDAFTGADVKIVGPSTSSQPSLTNAWWSKWADHVKTSGNVSNPVPRRKHCFADSSSKIPDWWSCHQLNGRGSANCGNDPVATNTQLSQVLQKYSLPSRPFQINEYAASDEQTPAYTAWFLERFERSGIVGLRANWGSNVGLHNDLAKLNYRSRR